MTAADRAPPPPAAAPLRPPAAPLAPPTGPAGLLASVVIPAYRAERIIGPCVERLLAQTLPRDRYEVVVVDDGSPDGTAEAAGRAGARVVVQANRGPAAARNHGAREARGEVLVFTDSDCEAEPDFLERMLAPFADPAVAGTKGAYRCRQPEPVARLVQLEYEQKYDRMAREQERHGGIDFIDTYAAAFRRARFDEAGGFDETFPTASAEDQELSFRLVEQGARLRFVPEARVWHTHARSWWSYARKKAKNGYWKVPVLLRHPGKAVSDSHTPQGQKVEIALAAALWGSLALAPLCWVLGLGAGALLAPLAALLAFLAAALGFLVRVARRDLGLAARVPLFLLLRATGLGLGFAWGLVRAPRLAPRGRPTRGAAAAAAALGVAAALVGAGGTVLVGAPPGARLAAVHADEAAGAGAVPAGLADEAAGDALAEHLANALRERDPDVRRVAFDGVSDPTPACARPIAAALADPDARVRAAALRCADALAEPLRGAVLGLAFERPDPALRRAAAAALAERPSPAAAPLLAEALLAADGDGDADLRLLALRALAAEPDAAWAPFFVAAAADVDARVRVAAVQGLAALAGPAAGGPPASQAPLREALAAALLDEVAAVRAAAAPGLGTIGSLESIGELAEALRDDDDGAVRTAAARALGVAAAAAGRRAEELSAEAGEPGERPESERAKLLALGDEHRRAAASAVAALAGALADADRAVVEASLAALEGLGPLAGPAAPTLAGQLPRLGVRDARRAIDALAAIGPEAAVAADALVERLESPDHGLAVAAALALTRLGAEGGRALARVAADPAQPAAVRELAVHGLRGADASLVREALPELEALAGAADPELQRVALDLVVGAADAEAVAPVLARALLSADGATRLVALERIREVPARAGTALPEGLVRALDAEAAAERIAAVRAAGALAPIATASLAERLAACLAGDPDPEARAAAAGALLELSASVAFGAPATAALAARLADPDPRIRAAALAAQVLAGPGAEALLAGLDDPDAAVRGVACEGLAALAELPDQAAVPLVGVLTSAEADSPLELAALGVVVALGERAGPAQRVLEERLGDRGRRQWVAAEALLSLGTAEALARVRAAALELSRREGSDAQADEDRRLAASWLARAAPAADAEARAALVRLAIAESIAIWSDAEPDLEAELVPRSVGALLVDDYAALLAHPEPPVRRAAAVRIANAPHPSARPALVAARDREEDPAIRDGIELALAVLAPPTGPGSLAGARVRASPLPGLQEVPFGPRALPSSPLVVGDDDEEALATAVLQVASHGLAAAAFVPALVDLALAPEDGRARRAARDVLVSLGPIAGAAGAESPILAAVRTSGGQSELVALLVGIAPTSAESVAVLERAFWAQPAMQAAPGGVGEGGDLALLEDPFDGGSDGSEATTPREDEPGLASVGARLEALGLLPALPQLRPDAGPGADALARAILSAGEDRALPFLRRALRDGPPTAGLAALEAVEQAGLRLDLLAPERVAPLVAPLALVVRSPLTDLRWRAIGVLASLGPTARAAAPMLVVALDDEDPTVARAALGALGAIGARSAREEVASRFAAARAPAGDPPRPADPMTAAIAALALLEMGAGEEAHLDTLIRAGASTGFEWAIARGLLPEAEAPLARWLREDDLEVAWRAALGLAVIGAPAFPRLVAALGDPEPRVRRLAGLAFEVVLDTHVRTQAERPPPGWLEEEWTAPIAGSDALSCTRWRGPHATEVPGWEVALAGLLDALARESDDLVLAPVLEALGTFGPPARPGSARAAAVMTTSPDPETTWRAAFMLAQCGVDGPASGDRLAAFLVIDSDGDGASRAERGWAAEWVREGGDEARGALERLLARVGPAQAAQAIGAMVNDGAIAADLLPALATCLDARHAGLREQALTAMAAVAPAPADLPAIAPVLERVRALAGPRVAPGTRCLALDALARLDPRGSVALFADALRSPSMAVAGAGAAGLAAAGAAVAGGAAGAEGAAGQAGAASVIEPLQSVVEACANGALPPALAGEVGVSAVAALGAMGARAEPALPLLARLVQEPQPAGLDRAALQAIAAIAPPSALPLLLDALGRSDAAFRAAAAPGVGAVAAKLPAGPERDAAVRALAAAVWDVEAGVGAEAARALAALGSHAAPVAASLVRALAACSANEGASSEGRPAAIVAALGAIGPGARGALPELERIAFAHPALHPIVADAVAKIAGSKGR